VTRHAKSSARRAVVTAGAFAFGALLLAAAPRRDELWRQVEIIRTAHGVPHIRAENLRAAGYALAWLQLEDYGPRTALNVLRARGEMSKLFGHDSIQSDFTYRRARARAVQTYPQLEQATRDIYDGFAAGLDRYVELHPEEFPAHFPADFSGYDVATLDIGEPAWAAARNFVARMGPAPRDSAARRGGRGSGSGAAARTPEEDDALANDNVGSNAWAFAPSRTKSGKAILLRNPHLVWTSGYYEAHMTVPGVVDFYGDFRIGGPFAVVGGFNRWLGWATTNNAQGLSEIYALDADPKAADHYLLDGTSLPLTRELQTVEFRNGNALSSETREAWSTTLGPVIHRANGKIYVVKTAGDGEFRGGEQFLRMMRAASLAEWKDAMRLRARTTSNFTYADHDGNIFFVWNARLPELPHPTGGDSIAIAVHETREAFTRYVPFDSLPQFLNPRGGYVHNENSSPHFTNVRGPIDTTNAYPNFEKPSLSLRSQLAIEIVGGENKVSLEDVVRMKHSYKMLLADRVKPALVSAVKATNPTGDVAAALSLVERWNNTAAADSKGAMLFEVWWTRYSNGRPDSLRYAKAWTAADPLKTPYGLSDAARATESFAWAVGETARRYGSFDVAWGAVHRVRRGTIDVPVGGCSGTLGCFRVLNFERTADGKFAANGGDGWVLAVEFTDTPRAYSVLAYGESAKPESRWFSDQAEPFAKGELKTVAFTERDVDAQAVVRYRPGEKP
jgi:acyl-homoserine-lactone acylase